MESKVCRLAIGDKYEEDIFECHGALQRRYSDLNSRAQNMEESEGMGFNENNYSPIPPVSQITSQQGTTRPTSTLKPMVGTDLNISDPTHNRGQYLSTTLMELANIQSRSLEMMAASQRSQQEAFQELTRASRDKANDTMFTSIKICDGTNRLAFEDWINKIDLACRASDRDFRMEIFKKSTGAV